MKDCISESIYRNMPLIESILLEKELIDLGAYKKGWRKRLEFNTYFLETMKEIRGSLICVFCGQDNLKVYNFRSVYKNYDRMATADHFFPKSRGGQEFKFTNLVPACWKCNTDKSNSIYPEESLKYLHEYNVLPKYMQ